MIRALVVVMATVASVPLGAGPAAAGPLLGPDCGVDLNAPQIALAVRSLRPAFRNSEAAWDAVPYEGNFDPCATLSTALVTVERATGSSPSHALFFHYGEYLGTATWEPYPFTTLNTAQTTVDTVVLDWLLQRRPVRVYSLRSANLYHRYLDGRPRRDAGSRRHRSVEG